MADTPHLLFLKDGKTVHSLYTLNYIVYLFSCSKDFFLNFLQLFFINSETEWLFSTPQGRKKLLLSANFDRLAIVSMHRGHIYTTWDDVKEEISDSIKNLAPVGLKNQQIPYLSLGSDVGNREVIYRGKSHLSGDYIVEEVKGENNKLFRRLVFLSNQFVIQSEALLKVGRYFINFL